MARIQFELTDRCAVTCPLIRRDDARTIRARNIFKTMVAMAVAKPRQFQNE
jgi:hypothetical protein